MRGAQRLRENRIASKAPDTVCVNVNTTYATTGATALLLVLPVRTVRRYVRAKSESRANPAEVVLL